LRLTERSVSILNMQTAPPAAAAWDDDRTARARIRDAAIARFADSGVAATSVRAIAEDAGVSPALVMHHFGSKDALRRVCDEHVVASIREEKVAVMGRGPTMDPLAALREAGDDAAIMRYLARRLVDSSPEVDALVDGMVDAAVDAVEEGVRSGMLEPTDDTRGLATVLTLWSLGILALHDHAQRLLGLDLDGRAVDRSPYVRIALEALRGIFDDEFYVNVQRSFTGADEEEVADHD
jgi:AcrR family transcriptional regulator